MLGGARWVGQGLEAKSPQDSIVGPGVCVFRVGCTHLVSLVCQKLQAWFSWFYINPDYPLLYFRSQTEKLFPQQLSRCVFREREEGEGRLGGRCGEAPLF